MHINHHPENLTVTVDANLTLRKLQAKLETSGQFLPVGPFENDITIKDIVDNNLLGPHAIEHGVLKNWVLGLTAHVNGEDVEFGAQVMKNVAGYDMTKLFIGAQCQLGKVKQVIFKVLPNQYKVDHEPSTILNGARVVLELSQIEDLIPDIKKEAGTYYHYEGLGILDVNVDNKILNIKARILGAKYIKLVDGFPQPEKSKHPQISENIHRIFNNEY
jgi:hypothetical protein